MASAAKSPPVVNAPLPVRRNFLVSDIFPNKLRVKHITDFFKRADAIDLLFSEDKKGVVLFHQLFYTNSCQNTFLDALKDHPEYAAKIPFNRLLEVHQGEMSVYISQIEKTRTNKIRLNGAYLVFPIHGEYYDLFFENLIAKSNGFNIERYIEWFGSIYFANFPGVTVQLQGTSTSALTPWMAIVNSNACNNHIAQLAAYDQFIEFIASEGRLMHVHPGEYSAFSNLSEDDQGCEVLDKITENHPEIISTMTGEQIFGMQSSLELKADITPFQQLLRFHSGFIVAIRILYINPNLFFAMPPAVFLDLRIRAYICRLLAKVEDRPLIKRLLEQKKEFQIALADPVFLDEKFVDPDTNKDTCFREVFAKSAELKETLHMCQQTRALQQAKPVASKKKINFREVWSDFTPENLRNFFERDDVVEILFTPAADLKTPLYKMLTDKLTPVFIKFLKESINYARKIPLDRLSTTTIERDLILSKPGSQDEIKLTLRGNYLAVISFGKAVRPLLGILTIDRNDAEMQRFCNEMHRPFTVSTNDESGTLTPFLFFSVTENGINHIDQLIDRYPPFIETVSNENLYTQSNVLLLGNMSPLERLSESEEGCRALCNMFAKKRSLMEGMKREYLVRPFRATLEAGLLLPIDNLLKFPSGRKLLLQYAPMHSHIYEYAVANPQAAQKIYFTLKLEVSLVSSADSAKKETPSLTCLSQTSEGRQLLKHLHAKNPDNTFIASLIKERDLMPAYQQMLMPPPPPQAELAPPTTLQDSVRQVAATPIKSQQREQ